jgi:hypothetical protein
VGARLTGIEARHTALVDRYESILHRVTVSLLALTRSQETLGSVGEHLLVALQIVR